MRITDPAGAMGQGMRDVVGALPASELVGVARDYAVADEVGTVAVSTLRGAVTITLPRAATCGGRVISVKKADAGSEPATIVAANGEPVAGQSWVSLTHKDEFVQLQSDGSEWQVTLHF